MSKMKRKLVDITDKLTALVNNQDILCIGHLLGMRDDEIVKYFLNKLSANEEFNDTTGAFQDRALFVKNNRGFAYSEKKVDKFNVNEGIYLVKTIDGYVLYNNGAEYSPSGILIPDSERTVEEVYKIKYERKYI